MEPSGKEGLMGQEGQQTVEVDHTTQKKPSALMKQTWYLIVLEKNHRYLLFFLFWSLVQRFPCFAVCRLDLVLQGLGGSYKLLG